MTPHVPLDAIGVLLRRLRRRLRLREALNGGSLALAVSSGAALIVILLLASLGPAWRWVAWLTLALVVIPAVGVALRPLKRWSSDDEVARELGRRTGLGDLVWSAVELRRLLPTLTEPAPPASPALVQALLAEVTRRVGGVDPYALVPVVPPRQRLIALAAVVLAYALAIALVPAHLARGWHELEQHPIARRLPSSEPLVADLELHLRYPAYMQREAQVITGISGDIAAPRGTEVELRGRLLAPAGALLIALTADERAAAQPQSIAAELAPPNFTVRFTVARSGSYQFRLKTPADKWLTDGQTHTVRIEPDQAPHVDLRAPADDLEIKSPQARIELAYATEDDYGIATLELVWHDAKGGEHRVAVPQDAGSAPAAVPAPQRRIAGTFEWKLSDVDLDPGRRVTYFLEASDNDHIGGPNRGRSRTYAIHLYSAAEKHEAALKSERLVLDHAVSLLGDRLDLQQQHGADATPKDSGTERTVRTAVHTTAEHLVLEIGQLRGDIDRDPQASQALHGALSEIHTRLDRLVRSEATLLSELTRRFGSAAPPQSDGTLHVLREADPRHVAELERDVLLLDDFISRQQLEELLRTADEMRQLRDRLRELLTAYQKSPSESMRKDIERELSRLEQKLRELEAKASQLRGQVPDEFLNRQAQGDNDLHERLAALRENLARGNTAELQSEIERLSRALDRLSQALDADLRGFRGDRFSAEEQALSEAENQLADLEHDQQAVARETEALRDQKAQADERAMRERMTPVLKQIAQEAEELAKRIAALDAQLLNAGDQQRLDQTRRTLDDLRRSIDQGDIEQARELARSAERSMNQLELGLLRQEMRQWTAMQTPYRKARGEVLTAKEQARRIAERLASLLSEARHPAEDIERSRELGQRQRELSRRTEALRQSLAAKAGAQRSPGMTRLLEQGLKETGEHMDRASGKLGEGEPPGALVEERAALEGLKALREQVAQARRPREGQAPGATRDEVVRIPGADEHRAPRDFREDLLEAMKRSAPEAYRRRVKRYYEELVR